MFLDVVVDDGFFWFVGVDDSDIVCMFVEVEKVFNEEVDEFVDCLCVIWCKINDVGLKFVRIEVKGVIEWV